MNQLRTGIMPHQLTDRERLTLLRVWVLEVARSSQQMLEHMTHIVALVEKLESDNSQLGSRNAELFKEHDALLMRGKPRKRRHK